MLMKLFAGVGCVPSTSWLLLIWLTLQIARILKEFYKCCRTETVQLLLLTTQVVN